MKKYSIIISAILILIVSGFYLWSAKKASRTSENVLSQFNKVEHGLSDDVDSVQRSIGIGAFEKVHSSSMLETEILSLIDSLKENAVINFDTSALVVMPESMQSDFKKLLARIRELNRYKWDIVDSHIPDTINYWIGTGAFSADKWLLDLEGMKKEEIITYLNFLRSQILLRK